MRRKRDTAEPKIQRVRSLNVHHLSELKSTVRDRLVYGNITRADSPQLVKDEIV